MNVIRQPVPTSWAKMAGILTALALAVPCGPGSAAAQPTNPSTSLPDDQPKSSEPPNQNGGFEPSAAAEAAGHPAPFEPVTTSDYWEVAVGNEVYVYIDALQIKFDANGQATAWVTWVNEGGAIKKNRYKYSKSLERFNCGEGKSSVVMRVDYVENGNVAQQYEPTYPDWAIVVPGTLGDAEQKFICSSPDTWKFDDHFWRIGGGSPVRWSDLFYAADHTVVQRPKPKRKPIKPSGD